MTLPSPAMMPSTTSIHRTVCALALSAWTLGASVARSEVLPHAGIKQLCMISELVVSGTYEGEDKLRIGEVLFPKDDELKPGAVLRVKGLDAHSREIFEFISNEELAKLETKQLLLFAKKDEDGRLTPMHHIEQGSQGVVWFDDHHAYRYIQGVNPGGYQLMLMREMEQGELKGKAALWKEVEAGFKEREVWEDVKGIELPTQRARALAMFCVKATAPDGEFLGADIAGELEKIGPEAIPAIADVLQQLEADEDVWKITGAVISIAYKVDKAKRADVLRPVVAPLVKWLEACDKSSPNGVLRVLELAADPRAAVAVRRHLKHEQETVRVRAALALAGMGDVDSFDAIAALLLKAELGSSYYKEYCEALTKIDADGAKTVIERAANQ